MWAEQTHSSRSCFGGIFHHSNSNHKKTNYQGIPFRESMASRDKMKSMWSADKLMNANTTTSHWISTVQVLGVLDGEDGKTIQKYRKAYRARTEACQVNLRGNSAKEKWNSGFRKKWVVEHTLSEHRSLAFTSDEAKWEGKSEWAPIEVYWHSPFGFLPSSPTFYAMSLFKTLSSDLGNLILSGGLL